jgi:hypothetical protein
MLAMPNKGDADLRLAERHPGCGSGAPVLQRARTSLEAAAYKGNAKPQYSSVRSMVWASIPQSIFRRPTPGRKSEPLRGIPSRDECVISCLGPSVQLTCGLDWHRQIQFSGRFGQADRVRKGCPDFKRGRIRGLPLGNDASNQSIFEQVLIRMSRRLRFEPPRSAGWDRGHGDPRNPTISLRSARDTTMSLVARASFFLLLFPLVTALDAGAANFGGKQGFRPHRGHRRRPQDVSRVWRRGLAAVRCLLHSPIDRNHFLVVLAGVAGGAIAIASMEMFSSTYAFSAGAIPLATSIVRVLGSPEAELARPRAPNRPAISSPR